MAFREDPRELHTRLADIERRLRAVEQAAVPPDPGWVLREVNDGLYFLYVPTNVYGPQIGAK